MSIDVFFSSVARTETLGNSWNLHKSKMIFGGNFGGNFIQVKCQVQCHFRSRNVVQRVMYICS